MKKTYAVRTHNDKKFLITKPNCRKIFTEGGNRVELDSDGMAEFPVDAIISVNKINPWEMQKTRMVKSRQILSDNAWILEKELSGNIEEMLEEEVLLSSLEVIETL